MKTNKITREIVRVCGMKLERWHYEDCVADFGTGQDWATLYTVESKTKGKGYATKLLKEAKDYYEGQGKRFGGSVALNSTIKHIYQKLNIKEYE